MRQLMPSDNESDGRGPGDDRAGEIDEFRSGGEVHGNTGDAHPRVTHRSNKVRPMLRRITTDDVVAPLFDDDSEVDRRSQFEQFAFQRSSGRRNRNRAIAIEGGHDRRCDSESVRTASGDDNATLGNGHDSAGEPESCRAAIHEDLNVRVDRIEDIERCAHRMQRSVLRLTVITEYRSTRVNER